MYTGSRVAQMREQREKRRARSEDRQAAELEKFAENLTQLGYDDAADNVSQQAAALQTSAANRRYNIDLRQQGHGWQRHVGKSESYLRNRLWNDGLESASSYTNIRQANGITNRVLNRNADYIERVMSMAADNDPPTGFLQLDYYGGGRVTGYRYRRGSTHGSAIGPEPTDAARVRLLITNATTRSFIVITSYPCVWGEPRCGSGSASRDTIIGG